MLICDARDIDCNFQIAGKAPLAKEEFDVVARVPAGTTKEQFRVMLQNLLIEEFGRRMQIESRMFPA